ncbi:peptidase C39 family protein [Candidatus Gottesmanbacteria bacterium]|nr:peptidase C39 family protein [Candidatus Gottesmanbacteria bacterium]
MKKILGVPFTRQTNSVTCALASLSMVLHYYKKEVYESKIGSLVEPMKGGKEYHIADMGRVALSMGFAADLYCYDFSNIFTKDHVGLSQHTLREHYTKWAQSKKSIHYRLPYLHFMEAGGELFVHVVSEKQLTDWIYQNTPPILLVECQPFYRMHKKQDCGHAIVLTGYDDDTFYLHDPLREDAPHAKGECASIPRPELLFSLYRRYGNALVIKPKD